MIGFDIDGTLTTLDKTVEVFNRETGKLLTPADITDYFIANNYGITQAEERYLWATHEYEINQGSLPNERIVNLFKQLAEHHPLTIITARPESMREVTYDWLHRYKIPYTKVLFGNYDKAEAFKLCKIKEFYDDRYENVLTLDNLGGSGILVNQPYNLHYDYERRI